VTDRVIEAGYLLPRHAGVSVKVGRESIIARLCGTVLLLIES
jgi:hypothetical protein